MPLFECHAFFVTQYLTEFRIYCSRSARQGTLLQIHSEIILEIVFDVYEFVGCINSSKVC